MKFLLNEGVKKRLTFTKDFIQSTVLRVLAAVKHTNGPNVKDGRTSVNDDPSSKPTMFVFITIQ